MPSTFSKKTNQKNQKKNNDKINNKFILQKTSNVINQDIFNAVDRLKVQFNNSELETCNAIVRYTSDDQIHCFILGYGKTAKEVSIHVDDLLSGDIKILKVMEG